MRTASSLRQYCDVACYHILVQIEQFQYLQIIILIMWHYQQITYNPCREDYGKQKADSVFLVYNVEVARFRFRSLASQESNLDRLYSHLVDDVGNSLQLDEFSIKQTVSMLARNHQETLKGVSISSVDGYLTFFQKNKFMASQSPLQAQENHQSFTQRHFIPLLEKFISILNKISPDLKKCLRFMGVKNLSREANSLKLDHLVKRQSILLSKEIEKTLKESNEEAFLYIKKIKKNKKEFYDNFKSQQPVENVMFGMMMKDLEETGKMTGDCENKTNLFQIEEIELQESALKRYTGGASEIEKIKVKKIAYSEDGYRIKNKNKFLVIKTPKQALNDQKKTSEYLQRFKREKNILTEICKFGKKPYLLNYYHLKDRDDILYVDYLDLNLNEFLYYYRASLTPNEIFSLCKQTMEIVEDLHECGVVHRDLKLSNFMVDTSNGLQLKLIDFSDSWFINEKINDEKLCGTLPYSPLQTSKNNKNFQKDGINKPQIDYWSVGILLHEIFHGGLPLTFTPCMAKDIHALWANQFLSTANAQRKNGLKLIQSGFELLKLLLLRVKPQERRAFGKAYIILCHLERYHQNTIDLVSSP